MKVRSDVPLKTKSRMFAASCAAALVAGMLSFTVPAFGDYESFPEGPGKSTLIKVCTQCHDIESLPRIRYTKAEWNNLVYSMKDMGAEATTAELDTIVDYLFKSFGKKDDAKK
jgi:hypothetical protein